MNKTHDDPLHEIQTPPPQKSNTKLIVTLVVLTIFGFSAASMLAGYIIAMNYASKNLTVQTTPSPIQQACTMDAKKCPDGSTVGRSGPTCEFSICPTVITAPTKTLSVPTIPSNPSGNTYRSQKHKVTFYYASKVAGSNETFAVTEINNKIYVYSKNTQATSGQWVEVFSKDPALSLEQAIKNQFLQGIASDTCFVQKEQSTDPNIVKATISYPVPTNTEEPFFMFGQACPQGYSRSNGMAYFYYDTRVPDKYFYFSIGQYGIPAYTDKPDILWQNTFVVQ